MGCQGLDSVITEGIQKQRLDSLVDSWALSRKYHIKGRRRLMFKNEKGLIMGTSNSYGGPSGGTPLVPSWLGDDGILMIISQIKNDGDQDQSDNEKSL